MSKSFSRRTFLKGAAAGVAGVAAMGLAGAPVLAEEAESWDLETDVLKSYWIADRQGRSFQRLNELFAVTGQVGFRATQHVDGRLVLAEAMKCLAVKS